MGCRLKRGKLASSFKNAFLVLFSLAITFFIIEVYFRLFDPQDLIEPMAAVLDQEIIYTLSPDSKSYLKGSSACMFHLETNSLGLREREIPIDKPSDCLRILLLGDSMSMAEGVELEEIYLKRLESMFAAHQIGNIETINAAIRGYGNDQELILFNRIGKRFSPDIVILAFYVGNDIDDNWNGQLFVFRDKELVQQPASLDKSTKYRYYSIQAKGQNIFGYSFVMKHSHLANWLRITIGKIIRARIYKDAYVQLTANDQLDDRKALNLTLAILDKCNQEIKKSGALPFIIILPSREDARVIRKGLEVNIKRIDLILEQFLTSREITFLNLTHDIVRYQGDFESLWLEYGHLSPQGHLLVAEALFDYLRPKINVLLNR